MPNCPKKPERECIAKQVSTDPWYECEYCGRDMSD